MNEIEKQKIEKQKLEIWRLQGEVDRLTRIINSYFLQYGTVRDQQRVIDKAKADFAREIFAEIEACMKDFEDDDDGYILKKCEFEFFMREIRDKYTESEND